MGTSPADGDGVLLYQPLVRIPVGNGNIHPAFPMGCHKSSLAAKRKVENTCLYHKCAFPPPLLSNLMCFFQPADLWEYYLPYLYSGISLFGVLLLLCKLIGFCIALHWDAGKG